MKALSFVLSFALMTGSAIAQLRTSVYRPGTIVDLSYPFDSEAVYWPTAESFPLEKDFENLANLNKLPSKGFTLIALPTRIKGGSGGPLRIVAVIPERK